MAKKTSADSGAWMTELSHSVGKFVHLETRDGIRREGRITGLRARKMTFNKRQVDVITELELNGDPSDCVQVEVIGSISIE